MEHQQQGQAQIQLTAAGLSAGGEPVALQEAAVLLHERDTVAIARQPLSRGLRVRLADGSLLEVGQRIQAGHKLALREIVQGQPVLRYGSIIGFATRDIAPGAHVHTHNL